jgi:hypothetical protein
MSVVLLEIIRAPLCSMTMLQQRSPALVVPVEPEQMVVLVVRVLLVSPEVLAQTVV